MTLLVRVLTLALGLVAAAPLAVLAQPPTGPEPGRVELGIGWMWIGREAVGSGDATETTSSGGALSLFSTSTELAAASGFEGRAGIKLTRALELEASGTYAAPRLRTEISGDYENAAPVTATEPVRQFTAGGGLLWYVRHHQARPASVAPFLIAGGGYLRALHEGSALVETGRFYEVGGGVKLLFRSRERTFLKGAGLRIDARAMMRKGGIAFDGRSHVSPALGAALYARF
jgi:hypothetical protein